MKQSSIHSNPPSDVGTTSFQTRKLFWHHPTKDVEHVPWHARPMFFLSPFINALNCCVFNFLSLSLQRLMSYQNIKSLLEIYRWNDWQIAAKFDNVSEGIFCYLSKSYWMGGLRINACFEDKKKTWWNERSSPFLSKLMKDEIIFQLSFTWITKSRYIYTCLVFAAYCPSVYRSLADKFLFPC